MKNIILGIIFGAINTVCAASLPYVERLDLDSASSRLARVTEPSGTLKRKFDDFLKDHDFAERSVVSSLEDKLPELPQLIPILNNNCLLKVACNLKRLHFLSATLKESYENIFCLLEFCIEDLSLEDTHRLWSCVSGCGYHLPEGFLERLNHYTAKYSGSFTNSLALSTLLHAAILPEGRAFNRLASMLSAMTSLSAPDDFHHFMFLKAYLTEVKRMPVITTTFMDVAIKAYQKQATYSVTTSISQQELAKFLQAFHPSFACEVFYGDLDTHLDIADKVSKIVVDMDGLHHYKEDLRTSKRFRRPLDLMRDEILLKRGWRVYRIRVDEWGAFKKTFATKMTERSTLEAFYKFYAVGG